MSNMWSGVHLGEIPVPILGIFLLCVLGIVASGKPANTLGRVVACIVSYIVFIFVFPLAAKEYGTPFFLRGLDGIPFYDALFGGGQTISQMVLHNFTDFAGEFFKLFVFCAAVDASETILDFAVKAAASIAESVSALIGSINSIAGGLCGFLGQLLPWIVRYFVCVAAVLAYSAIYTYVLSALPKALWVSLAFFVILATALMLLSPLLDLIALWVKLNPNKIVSAVSTFIKENKVGGTLQVSFFSAFLALSVFVAVQSAAPGALESLFSTAL